MTKNRQLKNLMIAPKPQLSLVLRLLTVVTVCMAVFIAVALVPLWYFVDSLRSMIGVGDPAMTAFVDLIDYYFVGIALLSLLILVIAGIWSLVYSHRIYGAQYAINRFIKDKLLAGDYSSRLGLRNYDFLTETAESLNELSTKLGTKS